MADIPTYLGPPSVTVSGIEHYRLTPDELTVVTGYRMIRAQAGSMIIEFDRQNQVIKWDVRPNLGSPKLLNEMLRSLSTYHD